VRGLPAGSYYISIAVGDAYSNLRQIYPGIVCSPACAPGDESRVIVADGADTPGIDFAFHPVAAIRGHVTDRDTHAPLSGVHVDVYVPFGVIGAPLQTAISAVSQEDGSFAMPAYAPLEGQPIWLVTSGSAPHVEVAYPNVVCTAPAYCLRDDHSYAIYPNDVFTADFALPLGGALTGGVSDSEGGFGVPANLSVYDDGGNLIWYGPTNSDGSYRTPAWPAGTYYFEARSWAVDSACVVYENRICPASGAPSADTATPIVLEAGDIRAIDMRVDVDHVFHNGFDGVTR
jgi:hypothetical protein